MILQGEMSNPSLDHCNTQTFNQELTSLQGELNQVKSQLEESLKENLILKQINTFLRNKNELEDQEIQHKIFLQEQELVKRKNMIDYQEKQIDILKHQAIDQGTRVIERFLIEPTTMNMKLIQQKEHYLRLSQSLQHKNQSLEFELQKQKLIVSRLEKEVLQQIKISEVHKANADLIRQQAEKLLQNEPHSTKYLKDLQNKAREDASIMLNSLEQEKQKENAKIQKLQMQVLAIEKQHQIDMKSNYLEKQKYGLLRPGAAQSVENEETQDFAFKSHHGKSGTSWGRLDNNLDQAQDSINSYQNQLGVNDRGEEGNKNVLPKPGKFVMQSQTSEEEIKEEDISVPGGKRIEDESNDRGVFQLLRLKVGGATSNQQHLTTGNIQGLTSQSEKPNETDMLESAKTLSVDLVLEKQSKSHHKFKEQIPQLNFEGIPHVQPVPSGLLKNTNTHSKHSTQQEMTVVDLVPKREDSKHLPSQSKPQPSDETQKIASDVLLKPKSQNNEQIIIVKQKQVDLDSRNIESLEGKSKTQSVSYDDQSSISKNQRLDESDNRNDSKTQTNQLKQSTSNKQVGQFQPPSETDDQDKSSNSELVDNHNSKLHMLLGINIGEQVIQDLGGASESLVLQTEPNLIPQMTQPVQSVKNATGQVNISKLLEVGDDFEEQSVSGQQYIQEESQSHQQIPQTGIAQTAISQVKESEEDEDQPKRVTINGKTFVVLGGDTESEIGSQSDRLPKQAVQARQETEYEEIVEEEEEESEHEESKHDILPQQQMQRTMTSNNTQMQQPTQSQHTKATKIVKSITSYQVMVQTEKGIEEMIVEEEDEEEVTDNEAEAEFDNLTMSNNQITSSLVLPSQQQLVSPQPFIQYMSKDDIASKSMIITPSNGLQSQNPLIGTIATVQTSMIDYSQTHKPQSSTPSQNMAAATTAAATTLSQVNWLPNQRKLEESKSQGVVASRVTASPISHASKVKTVTIHSQLAEDSNETEVVIEEEEEEEIDSDDEKDKLKYNQSIGKTNQTKLNSSFISQKPPTQPAQNQLVIAPVENSEAAGSGLQSSQVTKVQPFTQKFDKSEFKSLLNQDEQSVEEVIVVEEEEEEETDNEQQQPLDQSQYSQSISHSRSQISIKTNTFMGGGNQDIPTNTLFNNSTISRNQAAPQKAVTTLQTSNSNQAPQTHFHQQSKSATDIQILSQEGASAQGLVQKFQPIASSQASSIQGLSKNTTQRILINDKSAQQLLEEELKEGEEIVVVEEEEEEETERNQVEEVKQAQGSRSPNLVKMQGLFANENTVSKESMLSVSDASASKNPQLIQQTSKIQSNITPPSQSVQPHETQQTNQTEVIIEEEEEEELEEAELILQEDTSLATVQNTTSQKNLGQSNSKVLDLHTQSSKSLIISQPSQNRLIGIQPEKNDEKSKSSMLQSTGLVRQEKVASNPFMIQKQTEEAQEANDTEIIVEEEEEEEKDQLEEEEQDSMQQNKNQAKTQQKPPLIISSKDEKTSSSQLSLNTSQNNFMIQDSKAANPFTQLPSLARGSPKFQQKQNLPNLSSNPKKKEVVKIIKEVQKKQDNQGQNKKANLETKNNLVNPFPSQLNRNQILKEQEEEKEEATQQTEVVIEEEEEEEIESAVNEEQELEEQKDQSQSQQSKALIIKQDHQSKEKVSLKSDSSFAGLQRSEGFVLGSDPVSSSNKQEQKNHAQFKKQDSKLKMESNVHIIKDSQVKQIGTGSQLLPESKSQSKVIKQQDLVDDQESEDVEYIIEETEEEEDDADD